MKRAWYKFLLTVNGIEQRLLHSMHFAIRKCIEWCDAHDQTVR